MDDLDRHDKESLRRARSSAEPPEPSFERLVRRRERKHRNGRIASGAVALAVVAGLVAGGVWTLQHRPSTTVVGGSGPSGGSGVSRAPSGGATSPTLVAGPGQYYYWKTVRPIEGGNVVEEIWWGTDGSGRYVVDSSNPNYGTPKSQTWGPGGPDWFGPGDDLSGLSTDPVQLLQQLIARSSDNGASPRPSVTLAPGLSEQTSTLWRGVTDLLEAPNANPSLRAAVFEVASGLDGVTVTQDTEDPLGRPAISLSVPLGDYYCSGGGDDTMWFDPDTHLLLASNGDLGCAPSVLVVAGGIVDSTSDTVTPGDGFIPAPVSAIPQNPSPTSGTETVPAPSPSHSG